MSSEKVIVGEWDASFRWIQTPFGLVVSSLILRGEKSRIELEPFELELEKPAEWEARIEEGAMQMFVESRIPDGVKDVRISVTPSAIQAYAKVKVFVEIEAVAECAIRIHDGKQLHVEVESVSLGGHAAKNLLQQQLDKVNPILDAKDLPLKLTFERVELQQGAIALFGVAEP